MLIRSSSAARRFRKPSAKFNLLFPAVIFAGAVPSAYAQFQPTLPTIGPATYNVTVSNPNIDGGAVAQANNAAFDNTAVINAFLTYAAANGGGTVVIPYPGNNNYYGANELFIGNNTNLEIAPGAVIQNLTPTAAFISTAPGTKGNIEISGSGTINNNAMNAVSGNDMILLEGQTNVLVYGVAIENAPHEHLVVERSNNVTINAVTIMDPLGYQSNTDGIDYSGTNILIENCNIADGDDDICAKPGDPASHTTNGIDTYTANVLIQNCVIGNGHGLSIGGETVAGVNNVTVNGVSFNGTTGGLRLKGGYWNAVAGGAVNNVSFNNVSMTNVQTPIEIDSYYNGNDNIPSDPVIPNPTLTTTPSWSYVTYNNVNAVWNSSLSSYNATAYASSVAGEVWGLPQIPATNLMFTNVQIGVPGKPADSPTSGFEINYAQNVGFDDLCSIYSSSGATNDVISTPPPFSQTANYIETTPYASIITPANYFYETLGNPVELPASNQTPSLYDPDTQMLTVQGAGGGFGAAAGGGDQITYVYSTSFLFSEISAELVNLVQPATKNGPPVERSQAGIMIRGASGGSDPFIALMQGYGDILTLSYRPTPGAAVQTLQMVPKIAEPVFLNLRYSNGTSTIIAGYSTNGTTWHYLPAVNVAGTSLVRPNGDITMGLVVTPNHDGGAAAATFTKILRGVVNTQYPSSGG
jgi:hypothetical protein